MDADRRSELVELFGRARDIGLLGPGPVETHIDHALGYVQILERLRIEAEEAGHPAGNELADVGSGAGIPGLVIAECLAEVQVSLIDAKASRGEWLDEAVAQLGLEGRATVRVGEAQHLAHQDELRHRFDFVVGRGFAPPGPTAEVAAGLLRVGGRLLISEPPAESSRWSSVADSGLGFGPAEPVEANGYRFVTVKLDALPADRFPRQGASLRKRPAF